MKVEVCKKNRHLLNKGDIVFREDRKVIFVGLLSREKVVVCDKSGAIRLASQLYEHKWVVNINNPFIKTNWRQQGES